MKYSLFFLFSLMVIIGVACNGPVGKPIPAANTINNPPLSQGPPSTHTIILDTIGAFPNEINGCACYLASNQTLFKNHHYLYLSNYNKVSFLKINGKLIKFIQAEEQQINEHTTRIKAAAKDYQLIIEITTGKQNGDETTLKTGVLTVINNETQVIEKLYGECGC